MNMLLEFYFLMYVSLIRKESEKVRVFFPGIHKIDHLLQPILSLLCFHHSNYFCLPYCIYVQKIQH